MTPRFTALDADDPETVGGYALRARIGVGGMGRVYLAFTPGGRALAVKVVRPDYAHDPEFRRRFKREIKAARSVEGFYTAPVVDADSEASLPWLATAYVPGPSLADAVAEHGPLPLPTVFRLVAGVAEGLMAVHACGLVHRDLKPANILLADDGPRVIDFGIAHAASATAATVTGIRIGTPAYMAPEQVRGRSAGPPTDIFALGNLAVYAATGNAAFGEGNPDALFYRILHENPELDACPKPLRELVGRCLTKDPTERPTLDRVMSYAADHTDDESLDLARGWLPGPVRGTLAAYDTAMYHNGTKPKRTEKRHATAATAATEKRPAPAPTKHLPKAAPKAVLRVRNTARVTVRIVRKGKPVGELEPGQLKDLEVPAGTRTVQLTAPGYQRSTHTYGLRQGHILRLEVSAAHGLLFLDRPEARPVPDRPGARPGAAAAAGGGGSDGKMAGIVMAALALVVSIAVLAVVAWASGKDSDDTAGASGPTAAATTQAEDEPTDEAPYEEDYETDDTDHPTVEPDVPEETEETEDPTPSPEDEAFASVDTDDCLGNYLDGGGWNSTTPRVASCSDTGSYFRVSYVTEDGCDPDYNMFWNHDNEDGSVTSLCLTRNFRTGQCMYATAEGTALSVYWDAVTGCQASFPDKYEYIVQITRIYPDGAPAGACPGEWSWNMSGVGDFCTDAVWRRNDMPDL